MKRYPLSKTEYGIYIEHISHENSTAYNIAIATRFSDKVDIERLKKAIQTVISNHPYLNTAFETDENGEVYKYIKYPDLQVEICEEPEDELEEIVKPYDLANDRLYRIKLYKTATNVTMLLGIHHIIYDGTSNEIFMNQIEAAYRGEELTPETLNANDFALLEEEETKTESYTKAEEYYKGAYGDIEAETTFFHDKNDGKPTPGDYSYIFTYATPDKVREFAHKTGVKTSALFNSAFGVVMSKYLNAENVLFSTVFHGRTADTKNTMGMFVKTMPVHAQLTADGKVEDYLRGMDTQLTKNRENLIYSFLDFVKDTKLNPGVLFSYQGDFFSKNEFCGLEYDNHEMPLPEVKEDFSAVVMRTSEHFIVRADYRADLYDQRVVRNMLESLDKAVYELMTKENIKDIDILTERTSKELESFNEGKSFEIEDVVSLIRKSVEKYPDKIAVKYNEKEYTYKQLDEISERIAVFLRSKGIGRETVVSVMIPKSEYIAIASIGVLKSGAAYQPLDPSYPTERLEFMIADSSAQYLIADRALIDRIPNYKGRVLYLDEIPSLPEGGKIDENPKPEDRFIMLYTSGSTGTPKGVMLEHLNLATYCRNLNKESGITTESRVATYASYGFDASMGDIYPILVAGGTLYVIDDKIRLDLFAIKQYIDDNKITHMLATTQVGRQFAELFPEIDSLKILAVGGEKLVPVAPPKNYILRNAYGPTEATVYVNYYHVDKLYERVPIGGFFDDVKEYVVDKNLCPVPVGAPGELIIAGPRVARGYLNRPEQNAKAFIKNPFDSSPYFERAYRTGDVVRFLPDGIIDFVGRNDSQVKIRGFRIELTEVEAIIRQYEGIKDVTVQAFDQASGGKYIAAYIVADEKIDIDSLNSFISAEKPPYMVPAVTMQIDKIPLNQNQKVNKRALPVPQKEAEDLTPPQNDVQQKIFDCISEVIGTDQFSINSDIFDIGVTSIGSIKLNVLLSRAFDRSMTIAMLKENNTVVKLEKLLSSAETEKEVYELQADYPLTQTQLGIFVECTANPGTTIYNIPELIRLSDSIDLAKLKTAVETAVNAHPYVKTELFMDKDGDIRAKRQDDKAPEVELIKTDSLPSNDELVQPYNLIGDKSLYRIKLFETNDGNFLFLEFHHIICDGTSLAVILDDINTAYAGDTPIKEAYTGYELALDEEKLRKSETYDKAKAYYDSIFKGCDTEFLPPKDKSPDHSAKNSYKAKSSLSLDKIKSYCEKNGVTLNAFFTTAFGFVISKYSNKDEAVFTTIYNGRNDSRLANAVTMLVKTFPVYCNFDGEKEVLEEIKETAAQLMSSMSNDLYSFAEISRAYDIKADILFAYQGDNFEFNSIGGEMAETVALELNTPKAPISIDVIINGGELEYTCDFRQDMYSEQTIKNIMECIDAAANSFIDSKKFSEVSILSDSSWELIKSWNDTDTDIDNTTCNLLLEAQAEAHPDKPAVIADGVTLTYRELNEHANKIANSLIEKGIEPEMMVGVMMPRTVYAYTAREGVIKSGGAFMPIDFKYPDDRISYIFENSGAKHVITTEEFAASRHGLFEALGVEVMTVEKLFESDNTANPTPNITPKSLCYCIYTSGSTGKPKGVMIEHHSLVNFIHNYTINVQPDENGENDTVMLAMAALTFDISVLEESLALYNGGTAAIATEDEINNPILLAEMMLKNGVNSTSITPSYVNNMIDMPIVQKALSQMKAIDVGAENFPAKLYDKIRSTGMRGHIYNGYGPTEATIASIIDDLDGGEITIGTPIGNTKAYIIDKYRNILPVGVVGELAILGECVGRGYVALPEMTADKFITIDGLPTYRSGDLASWGNDGKIHFIGRMDNQVKLRGLRVELDEIENVINKYKTITGSKVVVKEDEKAGQYLCAYYTASAEVDKESLTEHMKQSLTHYMVPSVLVQLESFPLTANGKIDKKALPEPKLEGKQREGKKPKNELQAHLCEMLASVLNIDSIGIDEDFFELGGTSLLASKVAMKAMVENLPIAFKDVFDNPTVEALEKHIKAVSGNAADTVEEKAEETATADNSALTYNTADYVTEIKSEALGDVLLTGAAGFLGVHVLHELITTTDSKVYCLLRQGKAFIDTKLKNMLMYYFDDPMIDLFGKRIITVEGDITDRERVLQLGELDFGTVINCAACVKHFSNDETLEQINHLGVKNIVDMCVEHNKKLVQISTVSIAGTATFSQMSPDRKLRENELFIGQKLENKYINTKFKAEKELLDAVAEKGLRGKVIRVGNLMSRYSDGEFQINSLTNGFMSSLRAYAALGKISVSALDAPVEFSPIDCTASAVLHLATTPDKFTVFHAVNTHMVQMGDVIAIMNRIGIKIDIVDDDEFEGCLREALADDAQNVYVSPLISYLSADGKEAEFYIDNDSSFTTKALYRLGFKWPIINESYIENAFEALDGLEYFSKTE